MVQHSQAKRGRDIKTKLMAAVVMLLVASIMMVSTTYAWFTLSTAPEVTGITTSVGANGNLEMALLPTDNGQTEGKVVYATAADALAAIGTSIGGEATATEKNTTWGNLVDLSDTATYGLDKIVLYPSKLSNTTTLADGSWLEVPKYGSDGRVASLSPVGMTGVYSGSNFLAGGFGVRAVGSASGMSELELAYRSAKAAGNSAMTSANRSASTTLNVGGTALATLAMNKALGDDSFTKEDVKPLLDTYTALVNDTGAFTYIEKAFEQYAIAQYLTTSEAASATAEARSTAIAAIEAKTLEDFVGQVNAVGTDLLGAYDEVKTAKAGLETLLEGEGPFTWTQISQYVTPMGNTDEMTLNGRTLTTWMEKDDGGEYKYMDELVSLVIGGKGLTLLVNDGVYKEIANYTGTVTASVVMKDVTVPGVGALKGIEIPANMQTQPVGGVAVLDTVKGAVDPYVDAEGTSETKPIDSFYGYVIDLAFRTNAADSSLQLQTEGIDRIYSDNTANDDTMGGGASMTFTTTGGTGYGGESLKSLMQNVRIVFFSPEDGTILGNARLNAGQAVTTTEEATGDDGEAVTNTTITMPIQMWNAAAENGGNWATSAVITALTQNQAKAVSVLVYLDGETITNADVSTAELKGTMNLQFSSTAELTPMEYADLRNGGEGGQTGGTGTNDQTGGGNP